MLTLEQVKDQMTRLKFFCWALYLIQGGNKILIGRYPQTDPDDEKEKATPEIEADDSIYELENLVSSYSQDGEARFSLDMKKAPKSNQGNVQNGVRFKAGQSLSGLGGLGSMGGNNLGSLGAIAELFRTSKADNLAMMQVIAKEQLLEYKSQQLEMQKADFEKEKKAWYAEHKELKEKWEKLRDATKEGAMDAAPDLLKGIIDALRGDKTPDVKPLAGADAGKEPDQQPQTEEARIIEDMASWTFENVKDIYMLRRLNTAMKSTALRELSSFLALEVPDEAVREKIRGTVVNMVNKMKEGN